MAAETYVFEFAMSVVAHGAAIHAEMGSVVGIDLHMQGLFLQRILGTVAFKTRAVLDLGSLAVRMATGAAEFAVVVRQKLADRRGAGGVGLQGRYPEYQH